MNHDQHARSGLSDSEARRRLTQHGANVLPNHSRRDLLRIASEVLREPMLLLLVVGGAIYLAIGDLREALILMVSVVVVIGITVYQERKTERAIEALRDLSSPRALVIRGGRQRRIAGRDVVPGDLVILAEGDRVPADAAVLESSDLSQDESLLTGESLAVDKKAMHEEPTKMVKAGGEGQPFVDAPALKAAHIGVAMGGRGTDVAREAAALADF